MLNWFRGIFMHKKNDDKHLAAITYVGISVIGYICLECGYNWYEKRNGEKL